MPDRNSNLNTAAHMLAEWLLACKQPLFLTGAGISTDSGIPDFRGPQGFWKSNEPILFQDFISSQQVRLTAWERYFRTQEVIGQAEPNVSHRVLAELMELWPESWLVTQNVDGLHESAGSPAERMIEIHGNATRAHCLDCGLNVALSDIRKSVQQGVAPNCISCGGIVKSATISFGQPMPERAMRQAMKLAVSCDLCICLGTSLQVYPVAELPLLAKRAGAKLAIVNREETPLDADADLLAHDSLAAVLEPVLDLLASRLRRN